MIDSDSRVSELFHSVGCSGLSISTTETPQPSGLTSPEHFSFS